MHTGFLGGGKPEGKSHLEDPGIDGRIILRWIFRMEDRGAWTNRSDSGQGLLNAVLNLQVA